jgi:hypothetical protein
MEAYQKICNFMVNMNSTAVIDITLIEFHHLDTPFFTKFSVSDTHSWNIMSPRQPLLGMQVHGHQFLGHYVRQITIPRKARPWTTIPRILRPPDNYSYRKASPWTTIPRILRPRTFLGRFWKKIRSSNRKVGTLHVKRNRRSLAGAILYVPHRKCREKWILQNGNPIKRVV